MSAVRVVESRAVWALRVDIWDWVWEERVAREGLVVVVGVGVGVGRGREGRVLLR